MQSCFPFRIYHITPNNHILSKHAPVLFVPSSGNHCIQLFFFMVICIYPLPDFYFVLTAAVLFHSRKTAASYFIDIPCKPAMEPYRDRIAAVLSGTSAQNNHSSSKETHLCHSCATDGMFKDVDQGWQDSKVLFHSLQKVLTGAGLKHWTSLSHFTLWNARSAAAFSPFVCRDSKRVSASTLWRGTDKP